MSSVIGNFAMTTRNLRRVTIRWSLTCVPDIPSAANNYNKTELLFQCSVLFHESLPPRHPVVLVMKCFLKLRVVHRWVTNTYPVKYDSNERVKWNRVDPISFESFYRLNFSGHFCRNKKRAYFRANSFRTHRQLYTYYVVYVQLVVVRNWRTTQILHSTSSTTVSSINSSTDSRPLCSCVAL